MGHKCFISFKKEDKYFLEKISDLLGKENITGKSLDEWIDSEDIDYVISVIREKYMKNTSVTIFLIGEHSSENEGFDEEGRPKNAFIKRELQATLYDGKGFRRSGLLGIVLPSMYTKIYGGQYYCNKCDSNHNYVYINPNTTIKEFSANYYLKPIEHGCKNVYDEDGRFCVLVRYDDFIQPGNAEKYIEQAYQKTQEDISNYVHWRDLK